MKKKAIIIDDERLARLELRRLLAEFPEIEVVSEAANAEEGVRMIRDLAPDLVFLDIQMPVMDGFEAARRIRAADASLPLIALTAFSDIADRERAQACGFTHFVSKPVRVAQVAEAIEAALGGG